VSNYRPENADNEELKHAVFYAEQQLRFFMKRDEMNAEVHLNTPIDLTRGANVRYSPITYAAQMLVSFLWQQLYVDQPLPIIK
jgi:hypothetical protein